MADLGAHLAGMENGQHRSFTHQDAGDFDVHYTAEQAMGDNNRPARGYTTGHYHVTDPEGHTASFRHSPHGPGLMQAKPYAARQAAEHIHGTVKRLTKPDYWENRVSGRDVHPRSGRSQMDFNEPGSSIETGKYGSGGKDAIYGG